MSSRPSRSVEQETSDGVAEVARDWHSGSVARVREPEVCVTPHAVRTDDAGRRRPESPQRYRLRAARPDKESALSSERCVRDRS